METSDKRLFHRVAFDCPATLQQGEQSWEAKTLDLSLHGILLLTQASGLDADKPCRINVHLSSTVQISMECELRHQHEDTSGFCCRYIDLDSITHLRRLLEVNSGDAQLLERELDQLA